MIVVTKDVADYNFSSGLHDDEFLVKMALLLYVDKSGGHPSSYKLKKEELVSIFQWYYSLKTRFAKEFSHFFERIDEDSEQSEEVPNMVEIMSNTVIMPTARI